MIPHLLIAGNCLFSQIRCKVKTFSTISSINSQKLLLFAANLSFLLTFLQEYAKNKRKIVAIAFGCSKEECPEVPDAGCPWQEYLLHETWVVRGLQELFEDDYDSLREIIQFSSTLSCLEYNPRHDFLIFLMRMLAFFF